MTNDKLRIVAWELTRRCNLSCLHCRAAGTVPDERAELTTGQILSVMDDVARIAHPLLILTGGEPMLRDDLYEIIAAARERAFHVAVAPNGTLLSEAAARKMVVLGVHRVSISLDGATAEFHDAFRQVSGAFDAAVEACRNCLSAGLPFQINASLTARNLDQVEPLLELATQLRAAAFHVFVTVPVGRGRELTDEELSAPLEEEFLERLCDVYEQSPIPIRVTCAPQFYRILREKKVSGTFLNGNVAHVVKKVPDTFFTHVAVGPDSFSRGCIAGRRYVFISSVGDVQPCGYLPLSCGSVLNEGFTEIWEGSEILRNLRDQTALQGKCRDCDYAAVCGGCRARAYAKTGNYLAQDPYCTYEPETNER